MGLDALLGRNKAGLGSAGIFTESLVFFDYHVHLLGLKVKVFILVALRDVARSLYVEEIHGYLLLDFLLQLPSRWCRGHLEGVSVYWLGRYDLLLSACVLVGSVNYSGRVLLLLLLDFYGESGLRLAPWVLLYVSLDWLDNFLFGARRGWVLMY